MKTDDPKLTAYALGELGPEERAEIEGLLRADPEMAADIEATRAFVAQLRRELESEDADSLTDTQRAAVRRAAAPVADADLPAATSTPRWGTWMLRIAACLALLAIVAGLLFPSMRAVKENARLARQTRDWEERLAAESQRGGRLAINEPQSEFTSRYGIANERNTGEKEALIPKAVEMDLAKKELPILAESALRPDGGQANRGLVARGENERPDVIRHPVPPVKLEQAPAAAPVDEPAPAPAKSMPRPVAAATMPVAPGQKPAAEATETLRAKGKSATPGEGQSDPVLTGLTRRGGVIAQNGQNERQRFGDQAALVPGKSHVDGLDRVGLASDPGSSTEVDERRSYHYQESEEVLRLQKKLQEFQRQPTEANTEAYDAITDNPFLDVRGNERSTFSIDVDSASYANVRRFLNAGQRPPRGAIRIEELINYFRYDYPQPEAGQAFSATVEIAACPWKPEHRLARICLQGREVKREQRPPSNLVFLIDVSGSMQPPNKLPLVKESLRLLVDQLAAEDSVAIAVYAGASGCVLEPTHDKSAIRAALNKLEAGGSTNGASGIQLAYDLAQKAFLREGVNRVLLATDGDFNVGVTSQSALVDLIEQKAKTGIFLSVLGFGMGNLKDSTLEKLADKGNGNYAYIDTLNEGRRVLVEQMSGTLVTIAKDVKMQIEFNPAQVSAYRLIGYENRLMRKEEFNDDTKDAGEIGAGHSVTALYEIVPAGVSAATPLVDPLKYQPSESSVDKHGATAISRESFTLKLRHKAPDSDKSQLMEVPVTDQGITWEKSSRDFRFAAAVASFGMLLRDSPHKGNANWDTTLELAIEGQGEDTSGYRAEFISLIGKAKALSR